MIYPASTAALEAPIAAFNLSATSVISLKFSPLCKPLPPEITILAVPNSGLSDLISSLFTNLEFLKASPASDFTISAEPPVAEAGSKDAVSYTHLRAHET